MVKSTDPIIADILHRLAELEGRRRRQGEAGRAARSAKQRDRIAEIQGKLDTLPVDAKKTWIVNELASSFGLYPSTIWDYFREGKLRIGANRSANSHDFTSAA